MAITLELEVDAVAGVLVVAAHGPLTGGEIEPLRRCVAKAVELAHAVVLDCLAVDELDEHGLRLLRDAHIYLGPRLRVVTARGDEIHHAVTHAGLAHVLALHDTRPDPRTSAGSRGTGRFGRTDFATTSAPSAAAAPRT
jgi:hypothetical protein